MRYFESFVLLLLAAASFGFGVLQLKFGEAEHLPPWLGGTAIALFFAIAIVLALKALECAFNHPLRR